MQVVDGTGTSTAAASRAAVPQHNPQQQPQQVPGGHAPLQPGVAAAATNLAASQDLQSVPQLPAPPALQQAAAIITQAVCSRMSQPQHTHWQQQREALLCQLLPTAGTSSRAAGAQVVPQQLQAGRFSRGLPVVHCSSAAEQPHAGAAAAAACDAIDGSTAAVAASAMAMTAGLSARAGGSMQQHPSDATTQQKEGQQQPQQQGSVHAQASSGLWAPSYVLANLYRDGQQSVGSHADRLSSLGPLPTIASVSLGAGRVFRLHPADQNVAAAAAAAVAGSTGAAASTGSAGRLVSSIDIHLPHNSLLIMWAPTQEQWRHEVRGATVCKRGDMQCKAEQG